MLFLSERPGFIRPISTDRTYDEAASLGHIELDAKPDEQMINPKINRSGGETDEEEAGKLAAGSGHDLPPVAEYECPCHRPKQVCQYE